MFIIIPLKAQQYLHPRHEVVIFAVVYPLNLSKESKYLLCRPKVHMISTISHFCRLSHAHKMFFKSNPTKPVTMGHMFVSQISPLIPLEISNHGYDHELFSKDYGDIPQSSDQFNDASNIIDSMSWAPTLDDLNFIFKLALVYAESDPKAVFDVYDEYCLNCKRVLQ